MLTVLFHPAPDVDVDGILTVTCTDGSPPPPGHPEGITAEVPGHITFNKPVSGSNVFVEH